MSLFDEEEILTITPDFLKKLGKEQKGQICTTNLKEMYALYRKRRLRQEIIDLVPARPELEFPEARKMKRKFILHIGPTNSGKTYNALERLKTAESGVYLGPLRLLAYMTKFMNHMKETGKLAELQKKWFGETYDNLPTEAITSPEQFHKLAGL